MPSKALQKLTSGKADQQLICFPYLGGNSLLFNELAKNMGERTEIWTANLPGHGSFAGELIKNIDSLVAIYYDELKQVVRSNYLFLGYSMGGVVAYFLEQRIWNSNNYTSKPAALILSASGPPSSFYNKDFSSWSDDELLKYMASYGGISDEVMKEKSLLDYLIPIFRADFSILESSAYCDFIPLDIPVYFLWGEKDEIVSIDAVIQWSKYFDKEIHILPIENGSHMFIHDQLGIVTQKLNEIMKVSNKVEKCPS